MVTRRMRVWPGSARWIDNAGQRCRVNTASERLRPTVVPEERAMTLTTVVSQVVWSKRNIHGLDTRCRLSCGLRRSFARGNVAQHDAQLESQEREGYMANSCGASLY